MINGPTWCALSSRTRCPPPRTMCSVAWGISVAMIRWFTSGVTGSSSPATTRVGWPMAHSHGRLVQPNSGAIRYRAAMVSVGRRMCIERISFRLGAQPPAEHGSGHPFQSFRMVAARVDEVPESFEVAWHGEAAEGGRGQHHRRTRLGYEKAIC